MISFKSKIYIAGHKGLVGSAIVRKLRQKGYKNIIYRSRKQLDLKNQKKVYSFLKKNKPDFIFIAAAKVGGIYSNDKYRAEFIFDNLSIQVNLIHSAYLCGIKNLIFLGSSCVYPRNCKQPIKESYLLTGELEKTNDAYAIAKIAGIKMCESYNRQYGESHCIDYRSIMPTNLYGPGDNYHPENSHVIPGLINRFHEAKKKKLPRVTIWGTGNPKREFLYVDDMALASIHLMNLDKELYQKYTYSRCSHINVGSGTDLTIRDLSETIKEVVSYKGEINFDHTKADGIQRKFLDCKKIKNIGFNPKTSLKDGLVKTYQDFLKIDENF
jgi:GDP-L-fucose synthase